ncbi:MAG: cobalt-precorrin-6A reductase [Pseudomonadota bacterium]
MRPAGSRTVLLLGGSTEAKAVALWLAARPEIRLVTSLAGVTRAPGPLPGDLRIGGFGGAMGLRRWLEAHAVEVVVDATHPFAVRIARNARRAAHVARLPHLKVWRPAWTAKPGDRWHEVADIEAAEAAARKLGRRPFVALGRGGAIRFATRGFDQVVFRTIEPPPDVLPPRVRLVTGRGPFDVAAERRLFEDDAIDVLVTKNAGGSAGHAKLEAARGLGLPVVMIRRPPPPPPPLARDPDEARAWLAARLGG